MKSQRGKGGGGIGREETLIAAPLSHGSNPNSNAAGRRREDDENLVYGFNHTGGGSKDVSVTEDATPPLDSSNHGVGLLSASVRRLMPVECERLQALPDGWTDLGGTADSKRYAALGDAVTSTVAEWIGCRIIRAV
jgi:site-specific DNA-cytosine methylase